MSTDTCTCNQLSSISATYSLATLATARFYNTDLMVRRKLLSLKNLNFKCPGEKERVKEESEA